MKINKPSLTINPILNAKCLVRFGTDGRWYYRRNPYDQSARWTMMTATGLSTWVVAHYLEDTLCFTPQELIVAMDCLIENPVDPATFLPAGQECGDLPKPGVKLPRFRMPRPPWELVVETLAGMWRTEVPS